MRQPCVRNRWTLGLRFPKRSDVESQLFVERRALASLARRSPLPLPSFCFHGQPSRLFPRHFGGYEKLRGVPGIALESAAVSIATLGCSLGRFLSWLHRVPIAHAETLGVERVDTTDWMRDASREALEDLEAVQQVAPAASVRRWAAYLHAPPETPPESAHALVHGDLAAEHVLCDSGTGRVTGVIDWSEMAIGDRAVDLAALFHWGGRPLAEAAISSYALDAGPDARQRARYLAACRGAGDVAFGLETNRPEYVRAGLRALALCIG